MAKAILRKMSKNGHIMLHKNGHIMLQYYKATVFETGTKKHTEH